jgi:hypothetical protein
VAAGLGLLLLCALCAALLLGYGSLRPNRAAVEPSLGLESWDVVRDGTHNSNTDMIFWKGRFFLVHASSPFHMGTPRSKLVVRSSRDARRWDEIAELRIAGKDVRDPKLAAIGDELLLYALSNDGFMARPNRTLVASSRDGAAWSTFEPIGHPGWLLWRPKTRDGREWYAAAYWHEHGRSVLMRSLDGRAWSVVSQIHEGEGNDETEIELLPGGRILATARLEVTPDTLTGNNAASTRIAVADPPYTAWRYGRSRVTRLDGPVLFSHGGRVFAIGRHQPGRRGRFTQLGGVFSRKRTALYLLEEERLVHLSDLPSAGDTSYAGVVLRDGYLYADYYTSDIRRDYPWLLGMLLRSDVRIARVPLERLLALAEAQGFGPYSFSRIEFIASS